MKELYKGYYKKSEDEIKHIWDNGLITFDTNVLLNLYRYSSSTREEIIKVIALFSSKIFLTHQAGLEFHKNRFEVIAEQEKAYRDFNKSLNRIEEDLSSKSRHPFLSPELQENLNKILNNVRQEIAKGEKYYSKLSINDPIYKEIETLFDNKVEQPFSETELINIYEEGKKRYENKIPPGFEDETDKKDLNKYGDLIVWKQIIKKAKATSTPIVLITDESKKDWWWKLKDGKIIGPRIELVEEIFKESNVSFHMYSTESFLKYSQSYLNEKSNPNVIAEVEELKQEHSRNENADNHDNNYKAFEKVGIQDHRAKTHLLIQEIKRTEKEEEFILSILNQIDKSDNLDEFSLKDYRGFKEQLELLRHQKHLLKRELRITMMNKNNHSDDINIIF